MTTENQLALKTFIESDAGKDLMETLKEASRVSGAPTPVVSGVDIKETSSQAFAFHSGQSNIIEKIYGLLPKPVAKPLPPAFQPNPRPKQDPA